MITSDTMTTPSGIKQNVDNSARGMQISGDPITFQKRIEIGQLKKTDTMKTHWVILFLNDEEKVVMCSANILLTTFFLN